MKTLFVFAVFCFATAKIPRFTPEVYQRHLSKRHLFVIGCTQADLSCEKVQDDFEEEWHRFDKQNRKDFDSALFLLVKTTDNAEFYAQLTNNSTKHCLIYLEEAAKEQKQIIDPFALSQRAMREWLREIEAVYADKKIDQKIEELDIMINHLQDPAYLASIAQQQSEAENAGQAEESPSLPTSSPTPTAQPLPTAVPVSPPANEPQPIASAPAVAPSASSAIPPAATPLPASEQAPTVVQAAPQPAPAAELSPQPSAEAQKLQSQIDDEEAKNSLERNISINDIHINTLDNKEQELVKDYLQNVSTKSPEPAAIPVFSEQQPAPAVSQPIKSAPTPNPSNLLGPTALKAAIAPRPTPSPVVAPLPSVVTQKDLRNFSIDDIDITKLTPKEADVIIKYINDRRAAENKKKEQLAKPPTQTALRTPPVIPAPLQGPSSNKVVNLTAANPAVAEGMEAFRSRMRLAALAQTDLRSSVYIAVAMGVSILAVVAVLRYTISQRKKFYLGLNKKPLRLEDI